jgi:hypothetical protein
VFQNFWFVVRIQKLNLTYLIVEDLYHQNTLSYGFIAFVEVAGGERF